MKQQLLLIILLLLSAQFFAVSLLHISPQTYTFNQKNDIKIEIQQGLGDIDNIKVMYRIDKEEHWFSEDMKQDGPGSVYFTATLPAKYLTTRTIEYYFVVELKQGTNEYFPPQNETVPNYTLEPDIAFGDADPCFVLLTNEPITSAEDGFMLVVSFFAIADEIDPETIEVWVDGKNVTSQSNISSPLIIYKDKKPSAGTIKSLVRAQKGKQQIHSEIWSTEILPVNKFAQRINYEGDLNFASNYYDYSDADAIGLTKSNASSWADLYANYGKIALQADLYLSSLEHHNSQSVNRYTIGLNIPHLDFFAGDYAPAYSQLTFHGQNIRGIYSRLYTKSVSLSFTQGETVRKTTNERDVDFDVEGIQKSGTFKQEASGTRIQFGKENSFIVGFNLTHHKDEISSLDSTYYKYETTDAEGNGTTVYSTKAQENAVLAVDTRLSIPEQNIILGAEVAASLLNSNIIPGAISQEELEDYLDQDIPVNPQDFSDIFVINKNMIPLIPSRANIAWLAYFRTIIWNNLLNIQYAETGSAFTSFGANYQMQDSRVISVTDNFNISRFFIMSAGLNIIEDNLLEHKSETNTTNSWYLQSILRLQKIPYLKIAYYNNLSENEKNEEIESDFQKRENKSNSIIFGIGYNITQIPYVPTQFDISYKIGADNSKQASEDITDNENNGLSLTMLSRFDMIPLTLQYALSFATNKNLLVATDRKNKYSNIMLGANYSLLEERIIPYVNFRTASTGGALKYTNYANYTLGVEAYPTQSFSINTSIGLATYINMPGSSSDYNNFIWRVLLTQRF